MKSCNKDVECIINEIENEILNRDLTKTNKVAFIKLRNDYNKNKNNWILFYILLCYSFNNQARFNSKHEYNSSFGERSYNTSNKNNLIKFINSLRYKDIEFYNNDFSLFDFSFLTNNDFVYCDPPYSITTGVYNDGKRGFKGWTQKDDIDLMKLLDKLNDNGIKFAMSNVFETKGKINDKLIEWSKKYNVHHLDYTYKNCNYHAKNKDKKTDEVLICNY